METNFAQHIYDQLLLHPDAERIVWSESEESMRRYTAAEILSRISVLRAGLEISGLQPGQSVLLAVPVSFDAICSLLAVMAAGTIPVLPPAGVTPKLLLQLALRGRFNQMLTLQQMPFWVRTALRLFSIRPLAIESISPIPPPDLLPPRKVDSEQSALVSHSSGSTGTAKAIHRSHRVLEAQHQALLQAFPPWAGQRDFPLFPNVLLHNLAVGTISILPNLPQFKLAALKPVFIAAQLQKEQIDTLTGNVFYFRELLSYSAEKKICFPGVKAVGIGGSPVPEHLAQELKNIFPEADIYIIYGSSEAEPIAIRKVGDEVWNPRNGYLVGAAHPAVQVQFRKMETLILADGTERTAGEIGVQGAHVAVAGTDWLWTGDWGYLDADGQLVLTGRQGNQMPHKGIQHYQIEHLLSSAPGVKRVAARTEAAHFSLYVEGTPALTDLEQTLAAHFPAHLIRNIHFRDSLPVDVRHLSKIRYNDLE
jgi:acyl-coenzyme A synthetase/AMP-(fatty) acid ligase